MAAILVLTAATALAFYILIAYPLLLALLRERGGVPVCKDLDFRTSVSVVIAVHNGEAFLRQKLQSILKLEYPRELVDIIVVSDGSTDCTDRIASDFSNQRVRLVRVCKGGKASAVNAALPFVTGEIVFFTDVRQPLDPSALTHLVANFADPSVGAVTGELRLIQGDNGEQADMDLYWRYEVWARQQHSRIDSLFNTTGCIYAIRRSLTAIIPPDTLTDDALIPQRAFFSGYRVIFDPKAIAYDYPAVAGTEFKRRMRTLAGLWQVFQRCPQLFTSSNRMRWHFLSHKFGRLLLPWTLIAILCATAFLPDHQWRWILFDNEAVLLFLAAIDALIPRGMIFKRLTSPARTFLIMNAAALASIAVFFIPAGWLWSQTRVVTSGQVADPERETAETTSVGWK